MPSKILLLSKGIEIDILIQVYVIALDKAQGVTFKGGVLCDLERKRKYLDKLTIFFKSINAYLYRKSSTYICKG